MLLALSLGGPAVAQERVTAFVDVSVVPMDSERVLSGQTVLVRGARIVAFGPVARMPVPAGAVRVDGRGKFLIPGLADMHVHLGLATWVANRGRDDNAWDSAAAEEAVRRQLFFFAANGVTTIRNVDYFPGRRGRQADAVVLRLRRRAAAGQLWSPRIYTSGGWRILGDSQSIAENLVAYQAAGYDFIKLRNEEAAVRDSVIAAAHLLGLPFMGHVDDLPAALAMHYASIEHLTGYPGAGMGDHLPAPADTVRLSEFTAATQRAGVWNCPTQTLYEMSDTNPDAWPEARYDVFKGTMGGYSPFWLNNTLVEDADLVTWIKLRRRLIKALQDAGAGLLLGTDVPGRVAGFGVHRELQALVGAGLTHYQALATGTRNVAAYFGALAERGTVSVGKRADLVLLNGNPLTDIRYTAEPAGVMIGGRWLSRTAIDKQLAKYVVKR